MTTYDSEVVEWLPMSQPVPPVLPKGPDGTPFRVTGGRWRLWARWPDGFMVPMVDAKLVILYHNRSQDYQIVVANEWDSLNQPVSWNPLI